jgi:hypothetical protein
MDGCARAKNGERMDLKSGDFMVVDVTEISCNALKDDPLWDVFELWKQWASDRPAPKWPEVDMLALPPEIIPQSVVVDVVNGGEDFRYQFWGTGYADHYSIDETGNLLSHSIGPSFIKATFKQLQDVIAQQRPMAFEVSISTTLTNTTQKKNQSAAADPRHTGPGDQNHDGVTVRRHPNQRCRPHSPGCFQRTAKA